VIGETDDVDAAIQSKGKQLTLGVDYTISYKQNVKAGNQAYIVIKGKGGYKGSVTIKNVFTVKDVTLNDFTISVDPITYNGKVQKPAIRFIYKATGTEIKLKEGTAYTVKYKNTKNVSSKTASVSSRPSVTITEKGMRASSTSSSGKRSKTVEFTITTATFTAANVAEIKGQTYSGKAVQPSVTVKVNGRTLKANTDYVVTYTNNKGPGTATATVKGIGNYSGTVTRTFVIKSK
jgi:hypothetical protein